MRDRKEVIMEGIGDWEEMEGVERGETVIRMYCMRKESIFNSRKKELL